MRTSTYLGANAGNYIAGALTALLADTFAQYPKGKNFHWHVIGFRDYHVLFDEQAAKSLTRPTQSPSGYTRTAAGRCVPSAIWPGCSASPTTTPTTSRPFDMLTELGDDNTRLAARMRDAHRLCDEHGDVASTQQTAQVGKKLRVALASTATCHDREAPA